MKSLLFFFAIVIFSGCLTARKAPLKLDKIESKHPGPTAQWAAKKYPFVPAGGDTIRELMFAEVECPPIPGSEEELTVPITPEDYFSRTIYIDSTWLTWKETQPKTKTTVPRVVKVTLKPGQTAQIPIAATTITPAVKSTAEVDAANIATADCLREVEKERGKKRMWQGISIGLAGLMILLAIVGYFIIRSILKKRGRSLLD